MGPVLPFTSTTHPPLTEMGYICYLLLASLFPALISPPRLNPIPSHHASLCCEHGTNKKAAFFFSPRFSEMKMTSSSYPKFLSVLGLRKRSPFLLILFFLGAAPASFLFLKGGVATRGKNLKDRRCWFIVGWLCFFKFYFEF